MEDSFMTYNDSRSNDNNPVGFDQHIQKIANEENNTESESYDELVGLTGGASDSIRSLL